MRVLAGRYELQEVVGRGGMGEVWKGVDRELGRTVAVKVLPVELTRQDEFRQRFRREARTTAALSHHGVATLHDVGEDVDGADTVPFLVMEYIDGRTLAETLHAGPLPVARAVSIARDVADTLVHSHGLGLIHRDIKPSNIMVTTAGTVKVLDFGIAKALAATTTRLTATGLMVGTPAYLSPEQIDGDDVDARTDIYSLGCLLYELLTGRPPFTGDSPFAVMNQHLTKTPPPPSARRADVPDQVDALTLFALAKSPDQRYPDAAAFRSALESAQQALTTRIPAPPDVHAQPTAVTGRPPREQLGAAAAPPPLPSPSVSPNPGPGPSSGSGSGLVAPPTPDPYAEATPLPGPRRGAVGTEPAGAPPPGSRWAVRFRATEAGAVAVVGWVTLVISTVCVALLQRPFPAFVVLAGLATLLLSLIALFWSARLSASMSWALVVALNYAATGAPTWVHALPFVCLLPFAVSGFVRRRWEPALTPALLWLAYGAAWWAQTDVDQFTREVVFTCSVPVVVVIAALRGLADRITGKHPASD
ncbi:protein kinase domain-containing protein [Yinghuangia soli]|uniref:non-specific serine/threonine protein kinase n=1 Tax=Yinghuangia soli TaxID=2908204 RepID=A0AA41PYV6_9ACTN|nr:protein kinase [Yinghuangia soli]MCF2526992.1 protein kinase [Yinghuangia soli]